MVDNWHPTDWCIVSRALRSLYERLCYKGYEVGLLLMDITREWSPDMGWMRPVMMVTKGSGPRRIGWFGWLKGESKYVSAMELFRLI